MNMLLLLLTLSAAPLPEGEFWVPRKDRQGISRSDGRVTESRWSLTCERVEVRGVLVKLGDFTFNQRDGRVFSPSYETFERHVPLSGACIDVFPAAPRYATLEECRSHEGTLVITCEAGECRQNVPFVALPTCDVEMLEMTRLAELALSVDHEAALKTLTLVTALTKKGGKLWQRGGCEAVIVKPVKGGQVSLRGPDWETEGTFEPLFYRARMQGTHGWANDGGLGMWGSGPNTEPLLLGQNLIILGRRVLFTDESACRKP